MTFMKTVRAVVIAVLMFLSSCAAAFDTGSGARQYVRSLTNDAGLVCSGVTLAPGIVLTADHCVDGTRSIAGTAGALVARGDDRLDYAILSFPRETAGCPCPRIADYDALADEVVYVVGYPRGLGQVVTIGTSQGVFDHAGMPYGRRLVVTAPVAGGNSGGGVFVLRDGEFQLVGVLVEAIGHLSFAVPLVDLRPFLARHTYLDL